ncbi:MAG: PhoH family protein, partial [Caulobacteraceae bacterium]
MSRDTEEFISLSDLAVRAVAGPHSRHTALIEDAFHVLLETPGGGVRVKGDGKGRTGAKRAIGTIAA